MNQLRMLDPVRHAGLRWERWRGGAMRRIVPLGRSEVPLAAADMPLILAKDSQTGRFELAALVGLAEPINLFVSPEGYRATYQPRAAALGAFRIDGDGLALDEADASLGATGALLDADTLRSEINRLIADVEAGRTLARAWAQRGVLRPLRLVLAMAGGGEQVLDGLYGVSDAALTEQGDAAVLAMHRADQLAPAAVLTASLAQVERLRQLHNARFAAAITDARVTMAE